MFNIQGGLHLHELIKSTQVMNRGNPLLEHIMDILITFNCKFTCYTRLHYFPQVTSTCHHSKRHTHNGEAYQNEYELRVNWELSLTKLSLGAGPTQV